ncbi:hypothetical protein MUK42_36206 [Musa troglodytarum]|uniref:Uncharacterized protein n=1 Tax=Musa troglodytarum TaxID=320322 RepID=A0A9E7E9B1_9LILI|nr:hypothetical protein MUK42_36206 [Musa troglodytarum]
MLGGNGSFHETRTRTRKDRSYSPALTPEAPAFFNPFFLTIKLAPIKKLDESARTKPLMLSEDMPVYDSTQLPADAVSAGAIPSWLREIKEKENPSRDRSPTTASYPPSVPGDGPCRRRRSSSAGGAPRR